MEKKSAFDNFNYIRNGELYVFRDYKGLQAFRYTMAPKPARPYWALKDYLQHKKERRMEVQFHLPKNYLAGLIYKTPNNKTYQELAYQKAQEYFRLKLQHDVKESVNQLLPQLLEMQTHYSNMHFSFNRSAEVPLMPTALKVEPSTYDVPKSPSEGVPQASALPTAPPPEPRARSRLPAILENEYQETK